MAGGGRRAAGGGWWARATKGLPVKKLVLKQADFLKLRVVVSSPPWKSFLLIESIDEL